MPTGRAALAALGLAIVASDRAWNSRTFVDDDLTLAGAFKSLMPGAADAVYGETVTATGDHTGDSPYDCLSFGAVIFSTAVADVDRDGNPDGLEDSAGGLHDANGQRLPNLNALGASSLHQDLFVEMDAMSAPAGTNYGSPAAPFSSKDNIVTLSDPVGHRHMPPAQTLKILIDAYRNAPLAVPNSDGSPGITPHFDVGDPAPYIAALGPVDGPLYAPYFVPLPHARGGELVPETPCGLDQPPCNFQAFPGTVGWMSDFLGYSNRHFEKVRKGLFHWVFYVHARGKPKDIHPCLDAAGTPSPFVNGACQAGPTPAGPNPDFHVPSGSSGVGQLPGG
jgi:hypothetical protein